MIGMSVLIYVFAIFWQIILVFIAIENLKLKYICHLTLF